MSLLPLLLEMNDNPFENTFGHNLFPNRLPYPRSRGHQNTNTLCTGPICKRHGHFKPRHLNRCGRFSNIDKDGFQVSMDTKDFAPEEITVKTINDDTIMIEGRHEEKEDEHGHITRHFVRKYTLPQEVNINDVISTRSSDGVLTIKAPPKQKAITERVIEIQQTGEAHRSKKEKAIEKKAEEEKMTE